MRAPRGGAEESKPAEEAKPAAEAPAEEVKPAAEAPAEEAKPEEAKPAAGAPAEEEKPPAEAPVEEHPQPPNPGIRQPGTPIDMLPQLDFEVDRDMEILVDDLLDGGTPAPRSRQSRNHGQPLVQDGEVSE